MTTETSTVPPLRGTAVLLVTALAATVVGGLVVAAAALFGEGPDVRSAAIGAGLTVGVYLFGTLSVQLVAGVMPAMSLAVALMTYLLQVLVLTVALAVVTTSGAVPEEGAARTWLAGAVIAVTLAWMVVQVVGAMRARIPVYDLPRPSATGEQAADQGISGADQTASARGLDGVRR